MKEQNIKLLDTIQLGVKDVINLSDKNHLCNIVDNSPYHNKILEVIYKDPLEGLEFDNGALGYDDLSIRLSQKKFVEFSNINVYIILIDNKIEMVWEALPEYFSRISFIRKGHIDPKSEKIMYRWGYIVGLRSPYGTYNTGGMYSANIEKSYTMWQELKIFKKG